MQLTLDVLKNAKRSHATVSFLTDTGLTEATDQVNKYDQLMKDFPLNELLSATDCSLLLERQRFTFPADWLYVDHVDGEWSAMNELMARKEILIEENLGKALMPLVYS